MKNLKFSKPSASANFALFSSMCSFIISGCLLYFAFVESTQFYSTTRHIVGTNEEKLRLRATSWLSEASLCAKTCIDRFKQAGRNVQVLDRATGCCQCYISDVAVLSPFSQAPVLTSTQVTYEGE